MIYSELSSQNNVVIENWRHATLPYNVTIKDAIRNLDQVGLQIVLVVDRENKLIGTLSDGDIRRGLLKGLQLLSPIESIIFRNPVVVPESLQRDLVLQLMTVNKIRQIPIVDQDTRLLGLHTWDQLAKPIERNNLMVIMAGGRGTRMHPYTEDCPKPMLHIAGRPMLEHIIQRAKAEGFYEFIISIHYLGHVIENHFFDGSSLGVKITYLREEAPMGTAGALSLMEVRPNKSFVITNGDVMTDIRYSELLDFHDRHAADATMAVRLHEWQHPFGVVKMQGIKIAAIEEKPISRTYINAGVYTLSPSALDYLPHGEACDMPTLFDRIRGDGRQTIAYPMHEPWIDVGRPVDLEIANSHLDNQEETLNETQFNTDVWPSPNSEVL
jgi:dTDP-glucose pyrophosphorylase